MPKQSQADRSGLHNYVDSFNTLPPGFIAGPVATSTSPGWGWATMILPQLDQAPLYNSINFNLSIANAANAAAVQTPLAAYVCPSDLTFGNFAVMDASGNTLVQTSPSSYAGCVGNDSSDVDALICNGTLYRNSRVRIADIIDGTSNTVVVAERAWAFTNGSWIGATDTALALPGQKNSFPSATAPAECLGLAHGHYVNVTNDPDGGLDDFSSLHTGVAQFLFCDGSVRFFKTVVSDGGLEVLLQAVSTRAGGEVVGEF